MSVFESPQGKKILCWLFLGMATALSPLNTVAESPISDSCDAHRSDKVPLFHVRYRRAWTYNGVRAMTMNLSLKPSDITQNGLIATVCKLAREHANKDVLVLWVFDKDSEASRFRLSGQGISGSGSLVRASYSYDRRDKSQNLTWTPDTHNPAASIQVALGAPLSER